MTDQGPAAPPDQRRRGTAALRGAFLAYFIDMFDIYLPVLVLAPALSYFIPTQLDAGTSALVGGAVFAATLLGRPVGAALFGHLADTVGRRRATLVAVCGFGTCTLLLGLLPGHQQWGVWAIIAFVTLRFVDGIFLGGEYTAANPLAMEQAPPHRRGLYSSIINCGFPLAYAVTSVLTVVLVNVMPSRGLDSAYVQWGWRIPFFIGAAMSVGLYVYYARAVSESHLWQAQRHTDAGGARSPLREIFRSGQGAGFAQVFMLMTGLWLALQTTAALLPTTLTKIVGLDSSATTTILTISYLACVPANLLVGALSQRFGRRPVLIVLAVLGLTVAMVCYGTLINTPADRLLLCGLLVAVTATVVQVPFALMPAYINERFSLGVRGSGYGLAYSLSVILPSFYSVYQVWLTGLMPMRYTALALLAVGALLLLVGAAWGPETRDVELGTPGAAEHPAPSIASPSPPA